MTTTEQLPHLDGLRVLVIGTGAPAVSVLPEGLLLLRAHCPGAEVKVVLTRSALRFVTPTTVHLVTGAEFELDEWSDEPYRAAPHVELARWAQAVLVYPATLHFLGRLALGLPDSPLQLALQCSQVPMGLAPSLPPGAVGGHAYRRHLALLAERPEVVVVPPVLGRSMSTGETNVGAPARFTALLKAVDAHIREFR